MTDNNGIPPLYSLGHYVASLVNAVSKDATNALVPFGVSPLGYAILRRCFEGEGDTVSRIAQDIPVDASRISRVVTELTNMGLIRKRRLRSDRRSVRLTLTQRGREVVPEMIQAVGDRFGILMEGVTDAQYKAFVDVTMTIKENYDRTAED